MKTTVEIPDPLYQRVKLLAADKGLTVKQIVEEGLQLVLQRRGSERPFRLRDASVSGNGIQPGVDEGDWSQIRALVYEGRGG